MEKKDKQKYGFTVGDVPLHVFKEFMSDIKEKYNNVFWAKIMDLIQKAKAYDYLVSQGRVAPLMEEQEPEELVEEKTGVQTFGGLIENVR